MQALIGRGTFSAVVGIVALCSSARWLSAQIDSVIPAATSIPPDVQEMEKIGKAPPAPERSPDADELLKRLKLTRADLERRSPEKTERQIPPAKEEPPDVIELRKIARPPEGMAPSPSHRELVEIIRRQPGGAEKLDRAVKSAPPTLRQPVAPGREPTDQRLPGPRPPELTLGGPAGEQQVTLRATRGAPRAESPGTASLYAYAIMPWSVVDDPKWGPFMRRISGYFTGNIAVTPYMAIDLNITAPGWYIINTVAGRANAVLHQWNSSNYSYPTVAQWSLLSSTNAFESYPALFFLVPGRHYFYWVPTSTNFFWVSEVTLIKF